MLTILPLGGESSLLSHRLQPLLHAVHHLVDIPLWDVPPCRLQLNEQLLSVGGLVVELGDCSLEDRPEILDGIEVRGVGRVIHID
jgi:hypothetical protein